MSRIWGLTCALLVTMLVGPARAEGKPAGDAPLKVAVLDIRASGIDEATAKTFSEILAVEVARLPGVQVISNAEVESLLGLEQRKQMVGCDENVSCAAEIAGALGVDKLCTGSIGKVDSTTVLTLRLIDVRSAKVDKRLYGTETGGASVFIQKMPDLVERLFAHLKLKDASAQPVAQPPPPVSSAQPAAEQKPAAQPQPAAEQKPVAKTTGGSSSWVKKPWVWAAVGVALIGLASAAVPKDDAPVPAAVGTLFGLGLLSGGASLLLCVCPSGGSGGGDDAPLPVIHPLSSPFEVPAER